MIISTNDYDNIPVRQTVLIGGRYDKSKSSLKLFFDHITTALCDIIYVKGSNPAEVIHNTKLVINELESLKKPI